MQKHGERIYRGVFQSIVQIVKYESVSLIIFISYLNAVSIFVHEYNCL